MGYTATIGAATGWLSDTGTDENLNGTETCIISIPNISANLTIVATDGVGLLKWNGATLFEGTYTGANHKVDILDVTVIPTVYYKMTFKEITGDYTAEFASTIFGDICYAAGVTGSWTTGTDPQISVKFIRASCYDAASFLADIVNDDHWSEHATNTYTIGPRGSNKGALIVVEDDSASRIKDRKGLPNIIYVRGSDSVGKYIEGVYDDGIGTKVRSYTEKKASDTATLDLLAKKYYDQLHTEDGPSTIPVRIDQMYNKFVGDTVTMTSVPLGLSGSYRLSRIVRRLDSVSVSVTSPNKSLEQRVIDLKKYEDFGIYVTAGVSKSMQNWSSDILITPIDYDTANWSAGTIKFSDGDSQVIDSGTTGNLGVDGLYFLYFTLSDPTMLVTADYDIAVSATTAIFAKLTVVTGQIIGIESPNSATQTKINSVFISDDSVIAEAMSPGVQPYIADIEFSPVIGNEHNSVEWTAGTITFADGTTWATDPGNSGALPDGEFAGLPARSPAEPGR